MCRVRRWGIVMRRYVSELAWMGKEMDNDDGDDDDGEYGEICM